MSFERLVRELKENEIPGLPRTSSNRPRKYIQYLARFDGWLHYEIVNGSEGRGILDGNGKQLYYTDVAYVELHFELQVPNKNLSDRRIAFFARHIENLKGPFRFIPEWGRHSGLGFSLRYVPPNNKLEGVRCIETSDISRVRSELVENLKEFVKILDHELEDLTEKFKMEEEPMIEIDTYSKLLENAKQIILTGAPGTGKTYLARQVARSIVLSDAEKKLPEEKIEKLLRDRTAFVQFHPSYDYTDFVEGLRPIQGADGHVGFTRHDGTFKKLCKAAIAAGQRDGVDNFDEAWTKFLSDLEEISCKDNPLEIVASSCTFRVFVNRRGNLSFITSGTDKVQGSLTKANVRQSYVDPSTGDPWKCYYNGLIEHLKSEKNRYGLRPYVAGKVVDSNARQRYVMIIDEINRGDISKIFGELFYAIDDGYRGPNGRVDTQYQNLVEEGDVFAGGFYVPENIYIIGTMNDIDRNVESMDFAIRRRFTWEEVKPTEASLAAMLAKLNLTEGVRKEAGTRMMQLNSAISNHKNDGLGDAYQIGPSYFRKLENYKLDADGGFKNLWEKHLVSLIREYLRGMPKADDVLKDLESAYNLKALAAAQES